MCGEKWTPFGDFGKSFIDLPGTDLGIHAATSCLNAIGLATGKVEHLVFGALVAPFPVARFTLRSTTRSGSTRISNHVDSQIN